MYNQNSDLMKQEKFMLPTMIEGDFSADGNAGQPQSAAKGTAGRVPQHQRRRWLSAGGKELF